MASITLSGTLLDPNGDLAVGDQIRFTHRSTTGQTVASAVSIITVNPSGTYTLPLQYGLVLVEYKDVRSSQFKNLGVATVNSTNTATSIPELLNALVPVSSAELIEFQGILADAVAAKVAAEAAAATVNFYVFDSVADMKAASLSSGKLIKCKRYYSGGALISELVYEIGSAASANGFSDHTLNNGLKATLLNSGVFVASQCGAVNGASDSAAALNFIMTQSNYQIDGNYSVGSSLVVQNSTSGNMIAAEITALANGFDVLPATTKSNFEMVGNLKIIGIDKATSTSKGVNFFDCFDYKMDCNIDVSEFQDGIFCDGTTIAAGLLAGHRGRQGRWTNPTTHNNQNGTQVLRRAEYTLWTNPQSTQNTVVGWIQEAGNTNVIGGNIQDNQNGVLLIQTGTTNANHGMFSSTNINHNIGYNLRCEDASIGHTFNGCHFFGDSASSGTIELIRSSGINITAGIIDAKIILDGDVTPTTTVSGWNRISGNQINTTYTAFDSTNSGREKTIVKDNFQRNGDAWGLNDRAFTSVQADTVGGTQTITDATNTTIIFNNQRDDNRLQYNDSTGVFTALFAQNLTINFNLALSISGGSFIDGFSSIELDGVAVAYDSLKASSTAGTLALGSGSVYLAVQGGQTLAVKAFCNINAGTITVSAGRISNIGIKTTN
jgi:hypothetical protein